MKRILRAWPVLLVGLFVAPIWIGIILPTMGISLLEVPPTPAIPTPVRTPFSTAVPAATPIPVPVLPEAQATAQASARNFGPENLYLRCKAPDGTDCLIGWFQLQGKVVTYNGPMCVTITEMMPYISYAVTDLTGQEQRGRGGSIRYVCKGQFWPS
jgi:hypothetical protein